MLLSIKAAASCLSKQARMALPLAVQCKRKALADSREGDQPLLSGNWSTNTAEPPDRIERSTVSPTSSRKATRCGCRISTKFELIDAAMRARPGPMRTPRPGCASLTKSSARARRRCAARSNARGRLPCAIWPRLRPSGLPSRARSTLAARAITWTPSPPPCRLSPVVPRPRRSSPSAAAWRHAARPARKTKSRDPA